MRFPTWRTPLLDNVLSPLYVYLAAVGVLSATGGLAPESVREATPLWLTVAWSLAVAAAGVLTVAGCALDRNRLEAAGLALLVFGLGLYALAAVTNGGLGEDALSLAALGGCAYLRLRILRRSRKAVKHTRRQLAGGPHD